MDLGVSLIPKFKKDLSDRNRTSPFAFTGNKFEFRSLGSSSSIADANTVINTMVADSLADFYEILKDSKNLCEDVMMIAKQNILDHKRIIFGGDGYSQEWEMEAARRGLSNLKTTPDALERLLDDKNIRLFERFNVYTKSELEARYDVYLKNYCTTINIEALTMIDMVKKQITGSVISYENVLADLVVTKKAIKIKGKLELDLLNKISTLADKMQEKLFALETAVAGTKADMTAYQKGEYYKNVLVLAMNELRAVVDELETLVDKDFWPIPTYDELLFSVI